MPWLPSLINPTDRVFVTKDDYKKLKSAYTEAVQKGYEKMQFKGRVVEVGKVLFVLLALDREMF